MERKITATFWLQKVMYLQEFNVSFGQNIEFQLQCALAPIDGTNISS